jgi:hypothetical protein
VTCRARNCCRARCCLDGLKSQERVKCARDGVRVRDVLIAGVSTFWRVHRAAGMVAQQLAFLRGSGSSAQVPARANQTAAPVRGRRPSRGVGAFEASFTKPLRGACMHAKESRRNLGEVVRTASSPKTSTHPYRRGPRPAPARPYKSAFPPLKNRAFAHDVRTLSVCARPPPKVSSAPC